MSRSNVSSTESEIRSTSSSRSRGSIPQARSRSSGPIVPGRTTRSSASASAGEIADRLHAGCSEPLLRLRPDPGQRADRERGEEPRLLARGHDRDPARLAAIRGDLADDLRGRDAERARERGRGAHRRLHRLGDRACAGERRRRPCRDRGSPRRSRPARPAARPRGSRSTPPPSTAGRARGAAGRRRPRGSAEAPRPSSSRSGCRSVGRRSSPSRRPRDPAGLPPTTSGRVRSDGSSSSSTAAKNASRSRWARIGTPGTLRCRGDHRTATASGDRAAGAVPALLRCRGGHGGAGNAARDRARRLADAGRPAAARPPLPAPRLAARGRDDGGGRHGLPLRAAQPRDRASTCSAPRRRHARPACAPHDDVLLQRTVQQARRALRQHERDLRPEPRDRRRRGLERARHLPGRLDAEARDRGHRARPHGGHADARIDARPPPAPDADLLRQRGGERAPRRTSAAPRRAARRSSTR